MNFDGRQGQFFGDVHILNLRRFIKGFCPSPIRLIASFEAIAELAAVGFKLGVFNDALFVNLNLQAHHHITTGGRLPCRFPHSSPLHSPHVARVSPVVNYFSLACHNLTSLTGQQWRPIPPYLNRYRLCTHIPKRREFRSLFTA